MPPPPRMRSRDINTCKSTSLKDAPILILDEPTAALDTVSEALIFRAIERLREGRTAFVIAHRLSTVLAADRILLLNHGELVGEGNHETVIATSDLYRQLATQLTNPIKGSGGSVGSGGFCSKGSSGFRGS